MSSQKNKRREALVAKVREELHDLEEQGVLAEGNAFSSVLVLGSGSSLPQACEDALKASFGRLGYAPDDWLWLSVDGGLTPLAPELLARAIICFDPTSIVCVDPRAAEAFRESFASDLSALADLKQALFAEGQLSWVRGMRALNLGDFEASLGDPHGKQVSWARLKQLPAPGEPF